MMLMRFRGNRMRSNYNTICAGSSSKRLAGRWRMVRGALLMGGLAAIAICFLGGLAWQTGGVEAAPAEDGSYLGQAKRFLDSGTHQATIKPQTSASRSSYPANLLSVSSTATSANDHHAQLEQQLRQSIKTATELINNYRQNGLSSLPSLPNLPGVNTVMRLPDKLLRAELSMIQDELRMAMEMMNNPLAATMNAPRDIASMFYRMAEQLEQ